MNAHVTREQIHDLLDDLLTPSESRRVRAHLDGCVSCRKEHEALSETVHALRALSGAAALPRDLWDGIEARIALPGAAEVATHGADVVELPFGRPSRRRVDLTFAQAAAATILVTLVSAGVMWWATTGAPALDPSGEGVRSASEDRPVLAVGAVEYEQAVVRLEEVIEQGRDGLAPETLEVLRRSLDMIERALVDVGDALAADPSSETLARMLVSHQRSKLRLLRQAAISVQAAS